MSWDAIGAVGEMTRALAVVTTLAYLALKLLLDMKAVNSSALDAIVNPISIARRSIYENDNVNGLI